MAEKKKQPQPVPCLCGSDPAEAKSPGLYVLSCVNPACYHQPHATGRNRADALDNWAMMVNELKKSRGGRKCK